MASQAAWRSGSNYHKAIIRIAFENTQLLHYSASQTVLAYVLAVLFIPPN